MLREIQIASEDSAAVFEAGAGRQGQVQENASLPVDDTHQYTSACAHSVSKPRGRPFLLLLKQRF